MRQPTNEVEIERDVPVTVADGTVLLADIYHPVGVADAPTVLERTPYGRAMASMGAGPVLAARGYRYIIGACRGTDGSGGHHSYFAEAPDGRATADWIAEQPWFDGRLGTTGASYMGFTQWALASTKPPHLKAMVVSLSTSVRAYSWYPGGSIALEVIIPWDLGALGFNRPAGAQIVADATPEAVERRMAELGVAFDHLPLGDVLRHVAGEDLPLYQDQLEHSRPGDPFWAAVDFRQLLPDWTVPTLLIDGWHDYPLPGVIADYQILRDSPAPANLRIGAGGHLGGGGEGSIDATLDWFDTHLLGHPGLLADEPVQVHIQGTEPEWRAFGDWPPPATPTRWNLHSGGRLDTTAPVPGDPDRHTYDPADPTPSVGGIGMLTGGLKDNQVCEARPDVLVYTSDELADSIVILGPVTAEIYAESSIDHADVFVRLCDVLPDGQSLNVCDGLQRYTPETIDRQADGTFLARVELWPAGHRFGAGHRIRVQVSGGAHPVYARNLGTGEDPRTATAMVTADRAVHHDPAHPSHIVLSHLGG